MAAAIHGRAAIRLRRCICTAAAASRALQLKGAGHYASVRASGLRTLHQPQAGTDYCAGVAPEFQQDAARVLELAEKAMDTWSVLETDFLAPPVVWAASAALENVAGLAVRAWGGYPQACTAKFHPVAASALWKELASLRVSCCASHHETLR